MFRPNRMFSYAILGYMGAGSLSAESIIEREIHQEGEGTFVSTASFVKSEVRYAPSVTTLLTSEDISAAAGDTLSDLLSTVPGLHVSRTKRYGSPSFIFRGINSEFSPQTLMLINGKPYKSVHRGDPQPVWGAFPLHAIQRIEIVRGPASAVYGADAVGGVINVIMKKYEDINNAVGLSIGNNGLKNAHLSLKHKQGGWRFTTVIESYDYEGPRPFVSRDAQAVQDEQFDRMFEMGALPFNPVDASLAPSRANTGYETVNIWSSIATGFVKLNIGLQEVKAGAGMNSLYALTPAGLYGTFKQHYVLETSPLEMGSGVKFESSLTYQSGDQQILGETLLLPKNAYAGAFPDGLIGRPELDEDSLLAEGKLFSEVIGNHKMTLGFGYSKSSIFNVVDEKNYDSFTLMPIPLEFITAETAPDKIWMRPKKREHFFLYGEDSITLADDIDVTAGGRFDKYSDFGSIFSPRVSLVWLATHKLTLRALYGEAFRAPSFQQLYYVNNPVRVGNPNLKAERLKNYEISVGYFLNNTTKFSASLFSYKLENLIDYLKPEPPKGSGSGELEAAPVPMATNTGMFEGEGVELEVEQRLSPSFQISSNYSYVDLDSDDALVAMDESPRHQFFAELEYCPFAAFKAKIELEYFRFRSNALWGKRDDYALLDLEVSYRKGGYEFIVAVENLTDNGAAYRIPVPAKFGEDGNGVHIDSLGRNVRLGMSYRF